METFFVVAVEDPHIGKTCDGPWSMMCIAPSSLPPHPPLAFFASLTFSRLPQTSREDSDTSLVQTEHLFPQRIQAVSYFIKRGGGGVGGAGRVNKNSSTHDTRSLMLASIILAAFPLPPCGQMMHFHPLIWHK